MKRSFLWISLCAIGLVGNQAEAAISAERAKFAPAALYMRAAMAEHKANFPFSTGQIALTAKKTYSDANWSSIPETTETLLQATFQSARDGKIFDPIFNDPIERSFKRRATWLYPDDGCFIRAQIAAETIEKDLSIKPMKIFAFADLNVKTPNSPDGEVSWWYHVAAIMKVKSPSEKFYVYDPAINPKRPMEVAEWLKAMNAPDAEIAICSADTFDAVSDCASGDGDAVRRARSEVPPFLSAEWERLESLGRDPKRELGDFPPWL